MRSDAIGLFWQDIPRKRGERAARAMPPIPDTGWQRPTEYPNLSAAKVLSIDVETYDPELKKRGPGWSRGSGHIVGIAVGTEDGYRAYFPTRHTVEKDWNLEPEHVLTWARDNLTDPRQPKVGANLTYDVGWLRQEGVYVRGPLYDVEFAEALLQESATVGLDDLGERYLGVGKESNVLYEWCQSFYGGSLNDQRKNIYRAPPRLVGPYAEGDVDLPLRILELQWPLLDNEQLLELFDIECRLIYLMVEMRFAGVSVNIDAAEELREQLQADIREIDSQIYQMAGFSINTNAAASIAKAFDLFGLSYGRTKKGQPSFRKEFLKTVDHPIAELIRRKRAREKLIGTFVEGYILNSHVNGKVYGSFNQLRGDGDGARSGRLSSSNPNLQNIPIRSELGKKIRTVFVPDLGHEDWIKVDYSQIEYRGLAHFAVGPGSDDVRRRYNEDPKTDFHKLIQQIIHSSTGLLGLDSDRPVVKNINFGTVYGMGIDTMSNYLNLSKKDAKALLDKIHGAAPFMRSTMDATMREAEQLGYITTILGRRSRFDLWEPDFYIKGDDKADRKRRALPFEEALRRYGKIKRAYLHKSLNRRLQGSAADLIKMAMLLCWEQGVFAETGVPRLTVHDELDFSNPGGKDKFFAQVRYIMENAIQFKVPILVGWEVGPSWGAVEECTPPQLS